MSPETQNWWTIAWDDHAGRDVEVRRRLRDLGDQRRRPDQVADPDARADRLGEAGGVHHDAVLVEREHRGQRLAAEPDVGVRVVLEDREPVLTGQVEQRPPLLQRERDAGRVLVVRDHVRDPRAYARLQELAQFVGVDAVRLGGDGVHLAALVAQVEQRPVVRRPLDHHRVARLDQVVEEERVGLQRTVGDEHLLGRHAVLLGDPRAQRQVADRRSVRRDATGIGVEGAQGRGLEPFDVDDVQRGCPTGERDELRGGHV